MLLLVPTGNAIICKKYNFCIKIRIIVYNSYKGKIAPGPIVDLQEAQNMTSNMASKPNFRRGNEVITEISRWDGQRALGPKFFFSWLRYHNTQLLEWVSTWLSDF